MKMRREISYNTHDCRVTEDERIHIEFDMTRRCTITLNAIIRHGGAGVELSELTDHINKRLNALYSEGDIRYAARLLAKEGLVDIVSKDRYCASPAAKAAWKATLKQRI
jgi:predicted transcriptional regulator